ncbi:DAK2 domain-containing protein [Caproicibacterium sp. NSD3]
MINGTDLRNAMISAANNIAKHKSSIDKLNIFPVPDGDTGTNMSMTIGNAAAELEKVKEEKTAGEVAHIAASALLRGARGNSGVILSLLFRGFSKGTEGMDTLGGSDLVNALGMGVEAAYKAVMKPAEGTILTVSRVACEKGKAAAAIDDDPVYVWSAVCKGAAEALENTPELLPVLKKAGVVDAGGKGLCYIFEGMMSVFRDGVIIENDGDEDEKNSAASLSDDFFRNAAAEFDQEIHYTYCTEFIVGRNLEVQKDPEELRTFLETMGDCVVVVSDDEIIKVHVHTEDPGNALEAALVFGQLLTVKVDNMKEQHRKAQVTEAAKKEELKKEGLKSAEPTEEIGFISVAAGEGLATLFKDLGCTHVVSGGQTMNPSTEDILEAVKATPAKNVMILPNNKNIVMAAEQCIPLITDRKVIVLPTRTIPQGLSAMLSYDPESTTEENSVKMMEAAGNVNTGMVTFAARDSEFGGHKMKKGDILGLENGKMKFIEKDYVHTCSKLTRSMVNRATSFITIIYGQDVTEEQANDAYNRIKSHVSSDIEVTLVNGGQPVYYFIISVE